MAGNPIACVHPTDIVHYGADLEDDLRNGFELPRGGSSPGRIRAIRFRDIEQFQEARQARGS